MSCPRLNLGLLLDSADMSRLLLPFALLLTRLVRLDEAGACLMMSFTACKGEGVRSVQGQRDKETEPKADQCKSFSAL
jgi:hypothetical protein